MANAGFAAARRRPYLGTGTQRHVGACDPQPEHSGRNPARHVTEALCSTPPFLSGQVCEPDETVGRELIQPRKSTDQKRREMTPAAICAPFFFARDAQSAMSSLLKGAFASRVYRHILCAFGSHYPSAENRSASVMDWLSAKYRITLRRRARKGPRAGAMPRKSRLMRILFVPARRATVVTSRRYLMNVASRGERGALLRTVIVVEWKQIVCLD